MGVGRGKAKGRREPRFDATPIPGFSLRLSAGDRVAAPAARGQAARAPHARRAHRELRPDGRRGEAARACASTGREKWKRSRASEALRGSGGGGRRRSFLGRLVYWGFVLGLWAVIAAIGDVRLDRRASAADPVARSAEAPARHPDPRPRRPHARHARRHGRRRRRAEGPAAAPAAGLPRDRGSPLLSAPRHRPDRGRARHGRQHHAARRVAGRLDPDPAARQEPVPDPGAHARPQDPGARPRALARAQVHQGARSSSSISTASISAPAPTASKRRRSAISASRRGR